MKKILIACVSASMAVFLGCAGSASAPAGKNGGGYAEIKTPTAELQQIKKDMESKEIICGIGIGESNDEMIALTLAEDEGRKAIATSIMTYVTRLSEQYAQNVNAEAKKIWEEKTNNLTIQKLSGTTSYKSVTLFDDQTKTYKIYTLMVMNPELFKAAVTDAATGQEEMEMRVKSADMQQRLDAAVAAYQEHYKQ
ncbi:MAG TPA: hypothetical protein VLM37_00040 [Fibrobacteraceae bacterium]|nr:hypothetical protein [Fibrobacteraceae bacterium]